MRTLLAQSGGRWLQRVDSGIKSEADFLAEVAAQFSLDPKAVTVSVRDVADDDARQAIVSALAAGPVEGLAVIAAPVLEQRVSPRDTAVAKIAAAVSDVAVAQSVKDALDAIRKVL